MTAKLLAFSPPRPEDAGGDGDAHEQHRADRHAGDDGGQGAVGSEHVVVKPAEDVANAHEGSDDGGAGERDGALLQVADAPNLGELRINLVMVMRKRRIFASHLTPLCPPPQAQGGRV